MPLHTRPAIIFFLCAAITGGTSFFLLRHYVHAANTATVFTTSTESLSYATSPTAEIDVPILVYHIVRPSYPSDGADVRSIAVTPEIFDAQMKHLKDAGYHVVRFDDLDGYLHGKKPLPPKPVILSFDDGWRSQLTYALPILEKYHYSATFFVFTNSIDRPSFFSWNDLHTLLDAGMNIGSHTESHPYLTKISDPETLWQEISGSKQILEKNLGIAINEFASPFGMYNPTIIAMIKKAGYHSARGDYYTGDQTLARLYELSAMNADTTMALFKQKFPARSEKSMADARGM